ncbi:hypothetical protein ARMSODRAFT_1056284 [Armillaria solidipes]|uniref:Uncharacterized protein n=1 Tax=Armillaria solidipes TaxID=1076256 RepID=A0A2H3BWE7_9AGAR|nr:hypothetical protein ARMSODRAFT_1056284 [Armillaria solidipes]
MRHMSGASGRSISHMDCSCLAKILPFGSLTFRWCILKNENEDDPVRPSKTDFSGTSVKVKMDWFSRNFTVGAGHFYVRTSFCISDNFKGTVHAAVKTRLSEIHLLKHRQITQQISDTGNRTPSCRVRGGNVNRYTISDQRCKYTNLSVSFKPVVGQSVTVSILSSLGSIEPISPLSEFTTNSLKSGSYRPTLDAVEDMVSQPLG